MTTRHAPAGDTTGGGNARGGSGGPSSGLREVGFDWQMELAGGGDAVAWEIQVNNDLLLIREAEKE